jgi:hypothetical protein
MQAINKLDRKESNRKRAIWLEGNPEGLPINRELQRNTPMRSTPGHCPAVLPQGREVFWQRQWFWTAWECDANSSSQQAAKDPSFIPQSTQQPSQKERVALRVTHTRKRLDMSVRRVGALVMQGALLFETHPQEQQLRAEDECVKAFDASRVQGRESLR